MSRPKNEQKKVQISAYLVESDIIPYKRVALELNLTMSEFIELSLKEYMYNHSQKIKESYEQNSIGFTGIQGGI